MTQLRFLLALLASAPAALAAQSAKALTPAALDMAARRIVASVPYPRTREVAEVARQPHVVLHYFDAATKGYVAMAGRARVIRDRATKDAHWNPAWTAYYADRDTSVVLIVVQAEQLEIVSAALGVEGDKATWRPPTLRLRPPRPTK